MSCAQHLITHESVRCITLVVNLKEEKFDVSGEWSKEKFLIVLKNKLLEDSGNRNLSKENENISSIIFNQGIYNEAVISKLLRNGILKERIMKAMKCGLRNLPSDELNYFYTFNITPAILTYEDQLLNIIDKELLAKLISIGLNEEESLNIILTGLINQNQCCLFQLTSNGIAATKILNWQGQIIYPSKGIVRFLEKIGIDENTIQIVRRKGMNAEAQEMLYDLGYYETNDDKYVDNEMELVHSCNLEIKEEIKKPCISSNKNSEPPFMKNTNFSCIEKSSELKKNKVLEIKNYLRQNIMVPLAWALNKTLKYNPTNPIHYIACQLLRWQCNNVDSKEMNEVLDFVIDATIKMDQHLVQVQRKQRQNNTSKSNDVPSQQYLDKMKLHRIKRCSWIHIKTSKSNHASCQFPEFCSDCKLNGSEICTTASQQM